MCHHCGATRPVPADCPRCASPYLRQFGAGTQRVEAELAQRSPDLPVVRMDADTTKGKGGHERALAEFEALRLGRAARHADDREGARLPGGHARRRDQRRHHAAPAGLPRRGAHVPAARAGRRSGGPGERPGEVIIQTYWPDHPAILAAAQHDPTSSTTRRRRSRGARLSAVRPARQRPGVGRDKQVRAAAAHSADALGRDGPRGVAAARPEPAPLSRLKGVWRWHVLSRPLGRRHGRRRRAGSTDVPNEKCRVAVPSTSIRWTCCRRGYRRPREACIASAGMMCCSTWVRTCGGVPCTLSSRRSATTMEVLAHPNAALKQRAAAVDPASDEDLQALAARWRRPCTRRPASVLPRRRSGCSSASSSTTSRTRAGLVALCNPAIIERGDDREIDDEGCLSLPGITVPVERPASSSARRSASTGRVGAHRGRRAHARSPARDRPPRRRPHHRPRHARGAQGRAAPLPRSSRVGAKPGQTSI